MLLGVEQFASHHDGQGRVGLLLLLLLLLVVLVERVDERVALQVGRRAGRLVAAVARLAHDIQIVVDVLLVHLLRLQLRLFGQRSVLLACVRFVQSVGQVLRPFRSVSNLVRFLPFFSDFSNFFTIFSKVYRISVRAFVFQVGQ